MPGDPHFSFDRSGPLPILYKFADQKRNSERWKLKKCFFHHRAVENYVHRSHPVFAKKDFGRLLV